MKLFFDRIISSNDFKSIFNKLSGNGKARRFKTQKDTDIEKTSIPNSLITLKPS